MPEVKVDRLIRSKRKSVSFTIDREGLLIVRAPSRMPEKRILELVRERSAWITEKQREARRQLEKDPPHSFLPGERFLYLGAYYPLCYVDGKGTGLAHGQLSVAARDPATAQKRLISWYKQQAKAILSERTDHYAKEMGVQYTSMQLSSAKTRWGSCGPKNTLNLNWRLVMAPPAVMDYVVVHELAHTREKNHQKAFWNIVSAVLPDYALRREWLKENRRIIDIP